jgi:hypothetical protein
VVIAQDVLQPKAAKDQGGSQGLGLGTRDLRNFWALKIV